jgi:hypothetical protein
MRKGQQQNNTAGQARVDAIRAAAAQRNSGVVNTLRGGASMDPVGASIYNNERASSADIGDTLMFDKGAMVKLQAACTALVKQAGIGSMAAGALGKINHLPDLLGKPLSVLGKGAVKGVNAVTPNLSTGTKAMLGAGALATGYGAYKAGKGIYNYGMQPSAPHSQGGHAAGVPQYSNQFGVPVMG